jgi:SAM-dependent methyltransferase
VRAVCLRPLASWLETSWLAEPGRRLLDVGCGDMLLSRLLPPGTHVDGYDQAEAARQAARRAMVDGSGDTDTVIYDRLEDVPTGGYDGIVMSSVLQYLPTGAAVTALLERFADLLRPTRSLGVVATDVPSDGRNRMVDLWDLLRFSTGSAGIWRGGTITVRTVLRSPGDLLVLRGAEAVACAEAAGFSLRVLEGNLSPLRRRRSFVFERR